MLIASDGRRLRVVPDSERAFGAGDSVFGIFTVKLKPDTPGSINYVTLHLSLVTSPDGRNDVDHHSGYTTTLYPSAAGRVMLVQLRDGIPINRITTHQAIDRSGTRRDPRSFRGELLSAHHQQLSMRCANAQGDGRRSG